MSQCKLIALCRPMRVKRWWIVACGLSNGELCLVVNGPSLSFTLVDLISVHVLSPYPVRYCSWSFLVTNNEKEAFVSMQAPV